ncbi:MAG: SIS domain-containing protein [Lachnospiraceae bacterium]|nr:SIS domain-containing protein [Lachnospiraceae bacterium]
MYLEYQKQLFDRIEHTQFIKDEQNPCMDYEEGMGDLISRFSAIKTKEKQVFFVGNGGSSAIASHMTADFMKNGGMRTYNLYDNAVTTCMGNDYGYEYIFSKPLEFLLNEGDLLVAISSSGNSQNIINAIEVAKEKKAQVITFTGFKENNKVKQLGDLNVYVPIEHYGIVESIHNLLLQQIVDVILERDGVRL